MIRVPDVDYDYIMKNLFKICGHSRVRQENGFVFCEDCTSILPVDVYKEFYNYSRFFDSKDIYLGGKFIGILMSFLVKNTKRVEIISTGLLFGHSICIELEEGKFLNSADGWPVHKQISWASVQVYLWLIEDKGIDDKKLRKFFQC
jgi:hypothetical protein